METRLCGELPNRSAARSTVLVGGSGFVGTAVTQALIEAGSAVTIVDRRSPPPCIVELSAAWIECDILQDDACLPPGDIVILVGNGNPRPRWPWTLALDIAMATARLLPALAGRKVTLISSVEIYGSADPPLLEETEPRLPWSSSQIDRWCCKAKLAAAHACPPWRVASLCRELEDADPSGRWTYGLAKLIQETLVKDAVKPTDCTILRLANTFGVGQERVVAKLTRRALANKPLVLTPHAVRSFISVADVGRLLVAQLPPNVYNVGGPPISLAHLAHLIIHICRSASVQFTVDSPPSDSCGMLVVDRLDATGFKVQPLENTLTQFVRNIRRARLPLFHPALPFVISPRPAKPDVVADRQQAALWSGRLKNGNRWSEEFRVRLRAYLELSEGDDLILTKSGTDALRIAIASAAGSAGSGQVAILPSFTYPATLEVLLGLGYKPRFVDVDALTWTLDPVGLQEVLRSERVAVVVSVDTFGNPADYDQLNRMCKHAGVPLVADSAAALGALHQGKPVGTQAAAHAFSMSFAKTLSAGGSGGAVVLRSPGKRQDCSPWIKSALMDELHAAAAVDQLCVLSDLIRRRRQIAAIYERAALELNIAQSAIITPQRVAPGNEHSYVHWVARVRGREKLASKLEHRGVLTGRYFRALHYRQKLAMRVRLPITESLDSEVVALPVSSELTEDDAELVVIALEDAIAENIDRISKGDRMLNVPLSA